MLYLFHENERRTITIAQGRINGRRHQISRHVSNFYGNDSNMGFHLSDVG